MSERTGRFVTFEGGEGAGKSTQVALFSSWLDNQGISHLVTREPGGTAVGEAVRDILLDPAQEISDRAEILLYAASRAQLVETVIRPALADGLWVLCDRFVDSSFAYQGYGLNRIQMVRAINEEATAGLKPHLTFLLDLPAVEGLRRCQSSPDRIERRQLAFHRRVRSGFLELAAQEERFAVIDASQPKMQVQLAIRQQVSERLLSQGSE